jgi:CHASE3 domain sensor protein
VPLRASLLTKISLGFAAALAIIGVMAWASYRSDVEIRENVDWVEHTRTVQVTLDSLRERVADAETGARGYALTGSRGFLAPYDSARARLPGLLLVLRKLTVDNPAQQRRLDGIEPLVPALFADLTHLVAVRRRSGVSAAGRFVTTGAGWRLMATIQGTVTDMDAEEQRLLAARSGQLAASGRRSVFIDLASSLLAALLLGSAMFVILADLRVLRSARAKVKTLTGLLSICSNCRRVRDDRGYWHDLESFVESRSTAEFSHGVCPDCSRQLYGEFSEAAPET